MDKLRELLRKGRPGDDYWIAYWKLREHLTELLGSERQAVDMIRAGLAEPERKAA